MPPQDPFRPADEEARALALRLIGAARFGALAVLRGDVPFVTRVALGTDPSGIPVTLVSDLAPHTAALRSAPLCSILVGEPGPKGDPLTHPRLTIEARATFVAPGDPARPALRARYLAHQPKAGLYVDFADFHFVRLVPTAGHLNGGFGQAFRLSAADLGAAPISGT